MTTLRRERFAASDLATPGDVQSALVRTQQAAELAIRSLSTAEVIADDLACGTAGAQIRIRHGLNRRVRWEVIDWKRTTPGGTHGLERVSDDGTTLTLASYVAGLASVRVY